MVWFGESMSEAEAETHLYNQGFFLDPVYFRAFIFIFPKFEATVIWL